MTPLSVNCNGNEGMICSLLLHPSVCRSVGFLELRKSSSTIFVVMWWVEDEIIVWLLKGPNQTNAKSVRFNFVIHEQEMFEFFVNFNLLAHFLFHLEACVHLECLNFLSILIF
jgi:hypothetical protein